ncbi:hypothetical protein [Amycolatopsis australiensis]|uniref:hypothetical protein n=1 Tax=Amycolatopsis australiensis TaxID=546364 RepID=UPI0011613849|nr:hypothetical protein [Amycolatopsis australiensis]
MSTREIAERLQAALPADHDTDLAVVVIAENHARQRLPLRAAIAALETDLQPAGHTVIGRYWAPHTRPRRPLTRLPPPSTHLGTVIAPRTDLDYAAPVQLGGDAPTPTWGLPFTDTGETLPASIGPLRPPSRVAHGSSRRRGPPSRRPRHHPGRPRRIRR